MRLKTPYKRKKRRIGRGPGSGRGKTSGKGHKGWGARSGWRERFGYEGGSSPFYMRFPKRGFNRPYKTTYSVVNLDSLVKLGEEKISLELLKTLGWVKRKHDGVKVLARGELKKALVIEAHAFSDAARKQIEKAGGKAVVVTETNKSK